MFQGLFISANQGCTMDQLRYRDLLPNRAFVEENDDDDDDCDLSLYSRVHILPASSTKSAPNVTVVH
jgi:hypothetical protein